MAEEEVDLNPTSSKVAGTKRTRPIVAAPDDGILVITVSPIVLKGGGETLTKSRYYRDFSVPLAKQYLVDSTTENPTILSGILHGLIVDFFGKTALETIAKISSGDGEITEHSLIGDSTADYQVSNCYYLFILVTNILYYLSLFSSTCQVHFLK